MKRIFKKNFYYAVDCYEVWQDQNCIEDNDIESDIFAIVYGGFIHFAFIGMDNIGFSKPFTMNLNSVESHILEVSKEGIINENRIQYFYDDWYNYTSPYVCHLFCQFGRIDYVRFGYASQQLSNSIPWPDKLFEFYGDMVELGSFSTESKRKIDDIFRKMVVNAPHNNYNITVEGCLNENVVWNDMTHIYRKELNYYLSESYKSNVNWEILVSLYAESQIKNYFEMLGFVPKSIVDHICEDVFSVAIGLGNYDVEMVEQLKMKVYYDLTYSDL